MEHSISRVAIVHHSYTWINLVEGELRDFLLSRTSDILYITHPFKAARDGVGVESTVKQYKDGILVATKRGWRGLGHEVFFFLKDVVYTLWVVIRQKRTFDVYFGIDNLNAFTGIVLRRLGKVEKVIYYVIDYVPQRFSSKILNHIYHWVDRFCVKHADYTWNLSDAMVAARHAVGLPGRYAQKQITVPVGCHPLPPQPHGFGSEIRIVFLGILNKDQGIADFLEMIPGLIKAEPRLRFIIIGSGELAPTLAARIAALHIASIVSMKGFINNEQDVLEMLTHCHIGIAPYPKDPNSFKPFADPGKIKIYLSAGLPVVMTDMALIARKIQSHGAGVVVVDPRDMAAALLSIVRDEEAYARMSLRATELARAYDWNEVFAKACTASKIII